MRSETQSEQLFFTTVYLTGKSLNESWTGTGFIIQYETNVGTVPILVTNKHLVSGVSEFSIRFIQSSDNGQPSQISTEMTIEEFGDSSWVDHPNPEVDIAVMFLSPVINHLQSLGKTPYYVALPPELMLTKQQSEDLDALENVTFIGYPNGMWDETNCLPIARRGQTATPVQVDYLGNPSFLIDASVFGGSSGSPVFLLDRGVYPDRSGNATAGNRLALLGIVAAVYQKRESGDIVEIATKKVAFFNQVLNLGIVYKASAIQECVYQLLDSAGITILKTDTPLENIQ